LRKCETHSTALDSASRATQSTQSGIAFLDKRLGKIESRILQHQSAQQEEVCRNISTHVERVGLEVIKSSDQQFAALQTRLNGNQSKLFQECQDRCVEGIIELRAELSQMEQTILGPSECKRTKMAALLLDQQAKHTALLDEHKRILLEMQARINQGILIPNSREHMEPSTLDLTTTPAANTRIVTQLRGFLSSVIQYTCQHDSSLSPINLNYKAFSRSVISTASTGLRLIDLQVPLDAAYIAWLGKW